MKSSAIQIVACYYSSFADNGRHFRWTRLMILGLLPAVLSAGISIRFGPPTLQAIGVIIPVYSVLIAVLVGTIPIAHSVIGQSDPDRTYDPGQRAYANNEIDRIQALQDVIASISYAAMLLVVSLVVCICIAFVVSDKTDGSTNTQASIYLWYLLRCFAFLIYFGGVSSFFTFFDIAVGVFDAMEHHAETLKDRIRNNVKK